MSKHHLTLIIVTIIICTSPTAWALVGISGTPGCQYQSATCNATETNVYDVINCQTTESGCYSFPEATASNPNFRYKVYGCNGCKSGYAAVDQTLPLSPSCTISYKTCSKSCPSCSNCTSDTSWSAAGTGYEKKVSRLCNCGTCSATTSYRCAAGYYGSSTNGTSGCTRCPNNGSSSAGTTSVTGCCISSGSDAAGTYSYSPQCCYQ